MKTFPGILNRDVDRIAREVNAERTHPHCGHVGGELVRAIADGRDGNESHPVHALILKKLQRLTNAQKAHGKGPRKPSVIRRKSAANARTRKTGKPKCGA